MPELPEVETTRRGIAPYILGKEISGVTLKIKKLRWPIPSTLSRTLKQARVESVGRRAKYLLLEFAHGTLIIHLGMSGSLRIARPNQPLQAHEHVSFQFSDCSLRLRDPRKFGALIWTAADPQSHPLLKDLGPEPLTRQLSGQYLYQRSRGRKIAVKEFIMNSKTVSGVGNIYASEALFDAGIDPRRAAGRISLARYDRLTESIKTILRRAIKKGGTSLRDFIRESGQPGYFKQELKVYGRAGLPCRICKKPLQSVCISQRSSVYCSHCQT